MSVDNQVMVLYAGTQGFLDDVNVQRIKAFEGEFLAHMARSYPDVGVAIKNTGQLRESVEKKLRAALEEFMPKFDKEVSLSGGSAGA
jgi:F-type H+-transporting ATPase subunit alpha